MFAPREYQQIIFDLVREAFRSYRRVLLVSPTGSGKTYMFAYITMNAVAKGNRVIITAHRDQICQQISDALDDMGVRHGRIAPGHGMTDDPVQVAMVQTLARRLDRIPQPDLLIPDEAHHSAAGMWRTISEAWSKAKHLGVTATPERLDGRGLSDAFDTIVLGPSVSELIYDGHLAAFDYLAPPSQADISSVKTHMGDFAINELADIMDKSVITGDAVEHYRRYLNGRPAIAFCVTVAHAEHVAEQFRAAGFRAASVDGKMPIAERRALITKLGNGGLNVLTSCELISEGVDVPVVAGAILLRPTKSLAMFLQSVGRALRPKPDGSRAVILDHVGNVHRHGMPDAPREWSLDGRSKKQKAPSISTCETCFRAFPAGQARQIAAAECGKDGCPFLAEDDAVSDRGPPELVPGELVAIDAARVEHIRKTPLRQLLTGRETWAELEEIRKARGYHPWWSRRVMQERKDKRSAA